MDPKMQDHMNSTQARNPYSAQHDSCKMQRMICRGIQAMRIMNPLRHPSLPYHMSPDFSHKLVCTS